MRRVIAAAASALLVSLLAGCGQSPTAPQSGLTQQSADDLALQTTTSLGVLGTELEVALEGTPSSPMARTQQPWPARAQWDTTVVRGGITFEATRTFFDALDNELPDYGPTAVRMRWTGRAFGTYEGPRDTATVGRGSLLDVRGIQASQDTVQLDGACHDTLQVSFRSLDGLRQRWFYWMSSVTIDGVRLLKSTMPGGFPLDGTVTYVVSADRLRSNQRTDVEVHFDATVVVTFNGTNQPEIVVNGTYRYRWNLQTGTLTRA